VSEHGRPDLERRLRRAATAAATGQVPEPGDEPEEPDDVATARARLMEHRIRWVDLQVRQAMERGDFDNLPGAGKPIRGLGATHDPQWWVKGLIEREQITGVGPAALLLRKEDAELDARLDSETTADGVRRVVEDFNARVVSARRQLLGGPPVITPTRDPDAEVAAWRKRRAERQARLRRRREQAAQQPSARPARRWWQRW
jgi:DnaJ-like protein